MYCIYSTYEFWVGNCSFYSSYLFATNISSMHQMMFFQILYHCHLMMLYSVEFLWQIFNFSKRFSLRCRCVQVHFEFPLKWSHGSFSAERIWTMIKPLSQMIIFVNLDIYRRYNQCNVVSTKPLLSLVEFHLSSVKCTISKSNLSVLNTTALYCFFTAILSVWFVLMPRCLLALHQSTCFKWAPKPGWLIYLSA